MGTWCREAALGYVLFCDVHWLVRMLSNAAGRAEKSTASELTSSDIAIPPGSGVFPFTLPSHVASLYLTLFLSAATEALSHGNATNTVAVCRPLSRNQPAKWSDPQRHASTDSLSIFCIRSNFQPEGPMLLIVCVNKWREYSAAAWCLVVITHPPIWRKPVPFVPRVTSAHDPFNWFSKRTSVYFLLLQAHPKKDQIKDDLTCHLKSARVHDCVCSVLCFISNSEITSCWVRTFGLRESSLFSGSLWGKLSFQSLGNYF